MPVASVCNWLAVHLDISGLPFLLFPSANVGYYPKLYHSATSVLSSTCQCPVDVHSVKRNNATFSLNMNLEKYLYGLENPGLFDHPILLSVNIRLSVVCITTLSVPYSRPTYL